MEVECGDQHTAALSKEGYLFTWGYGGSLFSCGSLGHGDKSNQATPVVVDYFYDNGIAIKHISSGSAFMLALDENGDLYSWGRGSFVVDARCFKRRDRLLRAREVMNCPL